MTGSSSSWEVATVNDGLVTRLRAAGCVFAEDEARLLLERAGDADELEVLVARRVAGEPLEHVLGRVEFHGLRIAVDPGVFVPRRRTEAMVAEAVRLLAASGSGSVPVVVDLCCGCGAVGIAVAEAAGPVELWATDVDEPSVRCATRNVTRVGGRVLLGDLDAPLPPHLSGRVVVLTANVPYVPTHAIALMPSEARLHEPTVALDGGHDGLAVARRVAAVAPSWLAPGGALLLETSERQIPEALSVLQAAGLIGRVVRDEELEATVIVGTRPLSEAPR